MLRSLLLMMTFAGLTAAILVGCAGNADNSDEAASQSEAGGANADPEIEKALAELLPEDRKLAEQQKICPVTKEPLGSMGKPIKVDVDGRTVFVCCEGCVDAAKENPDEYLKNL